MLEHLSLTLDRARDLAHIYNYAEFVTDSKSPIDAKMASEKADIHKLDGRPIETTGPVPNPSSQHSQIRPELKTGSNVQVALTKAPVI